VTPVVKPVPPTVTDTIADMLPFTGMPLQGIMIAGLALVLLGIVMAFIGRRKRGPGAG
jgi:membrane protein implicated in regulation of membrane protease activity